jgi:NADH-quinone oxidoreductase subunit H
VREKLWLLVKDERGPMLLVFLVLQHIADGLKLIVKEPVLPTNQFGCFFTRPILSFHIQYNCLELSFGENIALADFNIGILYIFAVSS